MTIHEKLKYLKMRYDTSWEGLDFLAGLSGGTCRKWSEDKLPSGKSLKTFCEHMSASSDWLLGLDDFRSPKKPDVHIVEGEFQEHEVYLCYRCESIVEKEYRFCPSCGHMIDWRDIDG